MRVNTREHDYDYDYEHEHEHEHEHERERGTGTINLGGAQRFLIKSSERPTFSSFS
jgi:hypothetical protein